MFIFDRKKAAAVAADTQNAFATYDAALRSAASLTISFLDATQNANMPARDIQRLIQIVHESQGQVLSGRADMVSAVSVLRSFQRRSNQAETSFGCGGSGPWELFARKLFPSVAKRTLPPAANAA